MLPSRLMKLRFAFCGPQLRRRLLRLVAQGRDVGVAEQAVVVERHLGVQHDHVALRRHHQRVDLGQAAILVEEDPAQGRHDRLGLRRLLGGEVEGVGQPAGLERLQAGARIDRRLEDGVRVAGRHLLDLDAALLAGHQHRQAGGAVEDHADVDLAGDVGRLLHQHLAHLLAVLAGLLGDERVLEHDLGDAGHVLALGEELDAAEVGAAVLEAALAAAAGVDLGLEDDRLAAH